MTEKKGGIEVKEKLEREKTREDFLFSLCCCCFSLTWKRERERWMEGKEVRGRKETMKRWIEKGREKKIVRTKGDRGQKSTERGRKGM